MLGGKARPLAIATIVSRLGTLLPRSTSPRKFPVILPRSAAFWLPELAGELRRYPAAIGEHRIFPPKQGATSGRQRVEGSFEDLLERAGIEDFRFHDLRHTFASWYMMNGGDLYELAKILGHSNIKMTERYAKLARQHIARTGSTAREMWKLLEQPKLLEAATTCDTANILTDVRV